MIDLSLAGLIGAIVGTAVAAVNYGLFIGFLEEGLRSRAHAQTADEQAASERNRALVRRAVLALDILIFAGVGYWLGSMIGE